MALERAQGVLTAATTVNGTSVVNTLSFQPKALIFWTDGMTADGFAVGAQMGLGIASGTATADQHAATTVQDDNLATSNGGSVWDNCAVLLCSNAAVITAKATLTALAVDGFTLTWGTVNGSAFRVNYLALGGSEITNAKVITHTCPTVTGTDTGSSTALGFTPDALICVGANIPFAAAAANASEVRLGFGFSERAGAVSVAFCTSANDGQTVAASQVANRYQRTDKVYVACSSSSDTVLREGTISSWDAQGLTFNWTSGTSAHRFGILALKGTFRVKVGASAKPTGAAPANQDLAIGFPPRAALFGSFHNAASTAVQPHMKLAFGGSDGTNHASAAIGHVDAAINTIADKSQIATKALRLITAATAGSALTAADDDSTAAFGTPGANDLRLTWSPNEATASEILYLALGDAAAGGVVPLRMLLGVGL